MCVFKEYLDLQQYKKVFKLQKPGVTPGRTQSYGINATHQMNYDQETFTLF